MSEAKKKETCEDIIDEAMASRIGHLEDARTLSWGDIPKDWKDCEICGLFIDEDEEEEGCCECDDTDRSDYGIQEADPLCIDFTRQVTITFSTGGPADFVRLEINSDGGINRGTYHYQDWFDGAERKLDTDELDLMEELYRSSWDDIS